MTQLAELLKNQETVFAAKLNIARTAVKHTTQKGDILEDATRSMFQDFLPEKIGVASGVIMSADGDVSSQIDIILYDKLEAHLFYRSDKTIAIPIEYVFAIGEVKSLLDKAKFQKFFEVQRQVKLFRQHYKSTRYIYHGYGRDWSERPIASFLVCFDAKAESCFDWVKEAMDQNPINLCIDSIFCPDGFNIHWVTEHGPDLLQGTPTKVQCVKTDSLYFFLGLMSKAATYWEMYDPVAMYKYYQSLKGVTDFNASTIVNPNVQHPALKI